MMVRFYSIITKIRPKVEELLTTKFYIPHIRPELVSRPRLIKRLDKGLHRKLTLISAPAGFGKTTLVSEWVDNLHSADARESQTAYRIAWLSLDEGDNDPARFLAYLIAALNRVEGIETALGDDALAMLQSPQPPPTKTILTSLINEVAAISDGIVFVLDDYHTIESSPINDALTFLLEHLPPQMHLVTATRVDPPLPLARLRARGQLTELRAADLRFTSIEAAKFLNKMMGLNLSREDVAALETRTEGWIAGLQLAAISMQGHKDSAILIKSFTSSHRFVMDYLIEEVFEQQPKTIQAFLLQTSILNRLTGPLCDALTGQEDGQATLEMLNNANLFIVPLDEERRWYRYHQLFADLLRQRLYQTNQDQIQKLHRRASEWYEQSCFADESIEHALRGGDFERAASMIEGQFDVKYQRGEHTKLRRWLAALPDQLIISKPHLCILQAWDLFTGGQLDGADRSLQAAERMIDPGTEQGRVSSRMRDQLCEADRMKLSGRVAAIRAFIASYSGDIPGTIRHARKALDFLPEQELPWRSAALIALGDAFAIQGEMAAAYEARSDALETSKATCDFYLLMIANLRLAETLRQQGKLQQVIDICEQQMQSADKSGISKTVVVGWLLAIWGEVLAEFNDLEKAVDLAKKGVELTERGRDVAMIGWSNLCLVRVLFSRGDLTGAEEVIQKIERIAQEYDMPLWIPIQLSAWKARIWQEQGKLETVSQWVSEHGLDADEAPTYLHEMEYVVLARFLITQRRLDEAIRLLQWLLPAAKLRGRNSRAIEILILQALAVQAKGDTAQAMTVLERALTLAEPEGFIRTFVDEGLPMARLLYEATSRRIAPDYTRRLLTAFTITEPEETDSAKTRSPGSELIDPLSEREIEVLQLVAEGFTNQEIASRLYLSLNTVKVHTRNIYSKLGVNNRTHAGAKGRSLGILPST
jgi:ATP/maltotriose-dependent transcriptional regulator MalT